MSNLILNLQNGLINTPIYNEIQNEEIINLIEEYQKDPNDFIDYKNYFNEKCIEDYKIFLISNIINRIEKTFSKQQIEGDDGILENKILFLFKRYKKNIPNFISKLKINEKNFLDYIPEVKKLKHKINTFEDMNKDVSKFKKELDVYEKNIFDIITSDIQLYLDNDNISSLLNTFIKYCVKNNKKFINIKINYNEYNDVIISKFSDYKYENLDDMIDNLKSNELINSQELSYYITKYKIVKNQSFKTFISEFDDIQLTSQLINNYRKLIFDYKDPEERVNLNDGASDLFYESPSPSPKPIKNAELEKNIKKHIFIEIIEICEQPYSQTYLNYLKNIYEKLDMMNIYNNIEERNKIQNELIIEYENNENIFIKDIIKKINNNDQNLNHYILKRSINHNLNKKEYNDLKNEVKFFKDLINENNKSGVINKFILRYNQNIITQLIEFNTIIDINKVEKNLKNNPIDEHDDYIESQLKLYGIPRREKKNWIFISVHSFFKNNNFFNFMNFMKDLEKKINFLNDSNINNIFDELFDGFLSEFFNHYILCINNYKTLDLHPSANQLYYNYNDNKKIRVYINDPIEEIFRKIKNNPKEYQYIFQKLLNHLFNYPYYNTILDIDETIIDKVTHEIFLIRYINSMEQINNKLDKPIFVRMINNYKRLIRRPVKEIKGALKKIIAFNKKNQIIDENGIEILIRNWNDLKFLSFQNIINKSKGITKQDKIEALKFIKLFVNKIKDDLKEKKINISRNNQNKKQKKIIHDTSKELNRILNSSDPFPYKYVSTNQKKKSDFFDNYKVDISNIKAFEKNDMTFIQISNFKNSYKENKNLNIYLDLINNTIDRFKNLLNKKYNQKINFNLLNKNLIEDKNKIKIIAKKYHKNIESKNYWNKISLTKKTFSDIISLISIMFFFDNLINMKINFDLKSYNDKINDSIINKKIYILKSRKISRIKSKNNNYYLSSNNIKLKRNDFILYDSLIDQNVTIIKGNFKGYIGRLMKLNDIKNYSFHTKESKENQKKQISIFNKNIADLRNIKMKLKNQDKKNVIDDLELNELIQFRKDILRKKATQNLFRNYAGKKIQLHPKYEFNIKINPSIRKILNEFEFSFIKNLRNNRLKNIDFNLNILYNQKKHFIHNHKQQYIIRINEGEKSSKNIIFTSDEFKFNKDEILNQEIKQENLIQYQNLIIDQKYDNLYDFFKHIFNFYNISDRNNDQYFIDIYKEAIDIFNINKKNNMNKLDIKDKFTEDLRKLNKNIRIMNNKINKKNNTDKEKKEMKAQIKKYIQLLKKRTNQLDSINIDIEKDNLMIYKSVKKNNFKNIFLFDIDVVKGISYFKINNKDIQKDLNNIKINKKKAQENIEELQIKENKKIKKIFYDIKNDIELIISDSFDENPKMKFIDYINYNFIDEEEDDDSYSIDFDDILNELDEIEEEEENVEQRGRWADLDGNII